jgi:hypothetical protein
MIFHRRNVHIFRSAGMAKHHDLLPTSSECYVVLARVVGDDFPSEECAHLPKCIRLGMAKHHDILGIEGDDKLGTVALKHYPPSRSLAASQDQSALCCQQLPPSPPARGHTSDVRDNDAGRD